MKLTKIFTPKDHLRMINRFNNMLNNDAHNPVHLSTETLNKKLDWHTQEYISKTGKTPE